MTDIPYRPSSGTEGAAFESAVCDSCGHYRPAYYETYDCRLGILSQTTVYAIGEPGYPAEWVRRDGVPTCTAWSAP